jgi:hypothetical protein
LSSVYAIIGWIGPGGADEIVAFYGKYPFLLVVLLITTILACIAGTILVIVALSAGISSQTRVLHESRSSIHTIRSTTAISLAAVEGTM